MTYELASFFQYLCRDGEVSGCPQAASWDSDGGPGQHCV